ncbi:hypothetical protein M91_15202 [Bos mutus]|uniref:Uncharacterized protein n=1 Tax=Bos mutus TaxID=72004 RepID=L8IER3_9CETA|nr:hypothetical protein M91_15202 [Bos mutus]
MREWNEEIVMKHKWRSDGNLPLSGGGGGKRMEIILELQQSAQPHNTEAETQIDRQISQLVEGASGWQLWAIGCWTTIGKTEMEQGQKIAHFNAAQLLLSHGATKRVVQRSGGGGGGSGRGYMAEFPRMLAKDEKDKEILFF